MGLKSERREEAGPWRREVSGERERDLRAGREGREEVSLRERDSEPGCVAGLGLVCGRGVSLIDRRVGSHLAGDVGEVEAAGGSTAPGGSAADVSCLLVVLAGLSGPGRFLGAGLARL
jgi:hypothetical protein